MWFAGCSERSEGVGGPQEGVAIAFSLDCGDLSASVGAAETSPAAPAAAAQAAQAAAAQPAAQPAPARNAVQTRAAVPIASGTTVRIVALPSGAALGSTPAASATYYVTGEETVDGRQRAALAPCSVTNDAATGAVTACSADATKAMRLKVGTYDFYAYSPALPLKSDGKSVDVYHGMDFAASKTEGVVIGSDGSTSYPDPTASTSPAKTGVSGAVELQSLARKCSKLVFTVSPKVKTENGTSWSSVRQTEFKVVRVFKLPKAPVSAVVPDDIANADQVPMTTDVSTVTNPADFSANGIFELAAFKSFDTEDSDTENDSSTGSGIVLPKQSAEFGLYMEVLFNKTVDDGTDKTRVILKADKLPALPFFKNTQYKFKVFLQGKDILISVAIEPWNTVSDNEDLGVLAPVDPIVLGSWSLANWDPDNLGAYGTITVGPDSWSTNPNWTPDLGNYLDAIAQSGLWTNVPWWDPNGAGGSGGSDSSVTGGSWGSTGSQTPGDFGSDASSGVGSGDWSETSDSESGGNAGGVGNGETSSGSDSWSSGGSYSPDDFGGYGA